MRTLSKLLGVSLMLVTLSGCLVTSVVGGVVGTAVSAVDAVTPDIID